MSLGGNRIFFNSRRAARITDLSQDKIYTTVHNAAESLNSNEQGLGLSALSLSLSLVYICVTINRKRLAKGKFTL